jgi:hypothetical protein
VRTIWDFLRSKVAPLVGLAVIALLLILLAFAIFAGFLRIGRSAVSAIDDRNGGSPVSECVATRPGSAPRGTAPAQPAVLTPESQVITFKFDADRRMLRLPVAISADPALTGVDPSELYVSTRQLEREDHHRTFPSRLTHTTPSITGDGSTILFDLCLDSSGVEAGKYTGFVKVGGRSATVAPTTISVVATARSFYWFVPGAFAMLVAVLIVLTLKGVADYQRELKDSGNEFNRRKALTYIWQWEEGRLITSLVGVVIAVSVGFGIYNTDTTWGDDTYQDSVALVTAAITAVGAQSILDGLRGGRAAVQEEREGQV